MSNREIKKYDEKNNLIYFKNLFGYERWIEYNENNKKIHSKDNNSLEVWYKYDEYGNLIYHKESTGYKEENEVDENSRRIYTKKGRDSINHEMWYKYDINGKQISITKEEFEERKLKREKQLERLNRNYNKYSRFEIMDI